MNALLIISGLALLTLISEILNFKKYILPIVLLGLIGAVVGNCMEWGSGTRYYHDMMYFDNYAVAFSGLLIVVAFLWFLHSSAYFVDRFETVADKYALILFSLAGGVVMTSYANMVMLFIGIEILSMSMYVLAGSRKSDLNSNESAMKYFLMGSFATGFLLFGIALIYGVTGSFNLQEINHFITTANGSLPAMFYVGMILMLVGLSFKVSAAPFHFWTPDVYQGAPTIITTYMATVVKTAAFAAMFRLFTYCFASEAAHTSNIIWGMAALTILIGNLTAVYQNSSKRMLAYSSVAHAGYLLIAVLAMNGMSASAILLYAAAYSISTLAAFTVLVNVISATGSDSIESFNGLAKRNPFMAFVMVVAMLSLAGIPPTAGFFAKYYIFSAAMQSNYIWLVMIAILGSLIGVYYYFKIIIAMFREPATDSPITITFIHKIVLFITVVIIIVLGVFPNAIIGLI